MGPDYCANCATCREPCALGLPGRTGRLCPEVENRPQTLEGLAVWRQLQKFGTWSGGGMAAQRPDRAEIRRRLADQAADWIVDELIDVFEPAYLTFKAQVDKARRRRRGADKPVARRRTGRPGHQHEGDET